MTTHLYTLIVSHTPSFYYVSHWIIVLSCSVSVLHVCVPQSLEEQLKMLVHVLDAVCADAQKAHHTYNKLFHRSIR